MHKNRLKCLCILSGVVYLFIERVRQLLKEKGIYGKDMLADLEINKNQLTRWEKEDTVPTKAVLIAIADYLETTPEYLLGETDIKEKPSANGELDELDAEIIRVLSSLSDEKKKAALEYLAFLNRQESGDN